MRIALTLAAMLPVLIGCATPVGTAPEWKISSSATGTGLSLVGPDRAPLITIACTSDRQLGVTVPSFTEIASEDRLSFGLSNDPIALAAALAGAPAGVTASGPILPDMPDRIRAATAVSASYGRQSVGPFAPPGQVLRDAFARACATMLGARPPG